MAALRELWLLQVESADITLFTARWSEWDYLVDWLAAQPPLQRLCLVVADRPRYEVMEGMVDLARRRPALDILCTDEEPEYMH